MQEPHRHSFKVVPKPEEPHKIAPCGTGNALCTSSSRRNLQCKQTSKNADKGWQVQRAATWACPLNTSMRSVIAAGETYNANKQAKMQIRGGKCRGLLHGHAP